MFSSVSREYPQIHGEVLAEIEGGRVGLTPGVLGLVSAVRPRSKLLLELCVRVLTTERQFDVRQTENQQRAGQLFAEYFAGELATLKEAIRATEGVALFGRPAVIDTLCAIAPEDQLVGDLFERLRGPRRPRVHPTAFYAVMTARLEASKVLPFVADFALRAEGDPVRFRWLGERFLRRVRRDPLVREIVSTRIEEPAFEHLTPTLWRVLAHTPTPGEDFVERVRAALRRQAHEVHPKIAIDLLAGDVHGLVLSLLDSIDGLLTTAGRV
jgi:hypothetical protein